MADIAKGEIVMIKGGHIVSRDFVERKSRPGLARSRFKLATTYSSRR